MHHLPSCVLPCRTPKAAATLKVPFAAQPQALNANSDPISSSFTERARHRALGLVESRKPSPSNAKTQIPSPTPPHHSGKSGHAPRARPNKKRARCQPALEHIDCDVSRPNLRCDIFLLTTLARRPIKNKG